MHIYNHTICTYMHTHTYIYTYYIFIYKPYYASNSGLWVPGCMPPCPTQHRTTCRPCRLFLSASHCPHTETQPQTQHTYVTHVDSTTRAHSERLQTCLLYRDIQDMFAGLLLLLVCQRENFTEHCHTHAISHTRFLSEIAPWAAVSLTAENENENEK
jgi:hypothetical protein